MLVILLNVWFYVASYTIPKSTRYRIQERFWLSIQRCVVRSPSASFGSKLDIHRSLMTSRRPTIFVIRDYTDYRWFTSMGSSVFVFYSLTCLTSLLDRTNNNLHIPFQSLKFILVVCTVCLAYWNVLDFHLSITYCGVIGKYCTIWALFLYVFFLIIQYNNKSGILKHLTKQDANMLCFRINIKIYSLKSQNIHHSMSSLDQIFPES